MTITKITKTLSDGSLVYDVSLEHGGMIWFPCLHEAACDHFIRTIEMAVNTFTTDCVTHDATEETEL